MRTGAITGILAIVLLTPKVHAAPQTQGGCQTADNIGKVIARVKYVNAPDSVTLQADLNGTKIPMALDTQTARGDFTFFYSDLSPARKFGDMKFKPLLEGWTFTSSSDPVCENVSGSTVIVVQYRFEASRGWWRFDLAARNGATVFFSCTDSAGSPLQICEEKAHTEGKSLPIPLYVNSVSILAKYNSACLGKMEVKLVELEQRKLTGGISFTLSGCSPLNRLLLRKLMATPLKP